MGPQRPINRMGADKSSYCWIQNISSSQSLCSFVTRISLRSTHFRGALTGLSFSITIVGLVSPCQQLQFSLSTTNMKEKLNQEELNQKRKMEEVWNEIKGFSQSQKSGRNSLFRAHHLSLFRAHHLSLSTHATQAYGLIQTHMWDQRQADHTY